MTLIVKDISKSFGKQRVIDHLSLEVSKGEILGFLGPNGAGKSTTMKMICGYLEPDTGSIEINGIDVHNHPLKTKAMVGYLPESNPLYYDMYVREYLQFIARIHKLDNVKARIEEVIDITGLRREVSKKIGTLSKGYKQRVGIAQSIIHKPDVLILDEPTSGLDMNQLVEIRQLIRELGKESIVILSTHIMQEVESMCDRVVIINQGKLVADDPIAALAHHGSQHHELHIELLDDATADLLDGITGISEVHINGRSIVIYYDSNIDIRPDVFDRIVAREHKILSMTTEQKGIEDIFHQLTTASK